MAILAMLMARSATGHVQYNEMSIRKPDWSEGIPTLQMNPTPTQIWEWNARAALAVKAATGSDFLVKMKNGLTKGTNKETNMTQVICHAQNDPDQEGYDLLQNVDEKHEVWMLHMVGVAIAAGAPIGGVTPLRATARRRVRKTRPMEKARKTRRRRVKMNMDWSKAVLHGRPLIMFNPFKQQPSHTMVHPLAMQRADAMSDRIMMPDLHESQRLYCKRLGEIIFDGTIEGLCRLSQTEQRVGSANAKKDRDGPLYCCRCISPLFMHNQENA